MPEALMDECVGIREVAGLALATGGLSLFVYSAGQLLVALTAAGGIGLLAGLAATALGGWLLGKAGPASETA